MALKLTSNSTARMSSVVSLDWANITSKTLTGVTGTVPISSGVSGLGTGVATFLGTPSSANLIAAVTDETGTGPLVFANSPTLVTPALGTPASGVATNLTGTAAGLTAGTVTTIPNLTGPVTSTGNATAIANNQITRAMEAQGVARSVVGVTGNATANVADIQGTANQFLGVNSGGTALAFQTMSQDATLASGVITVTKTNNVSFTSLATAAVGQIPGETSTGSATAGNVGELITSTIVAGSAAALTTATNLNVTTISLTAGDWDVSGTVTFSGGATTTVLFLDASISTTSVTIDTTPERRGQIFYNNVAVFASITPSLPLTPTRMSVSGPTTVYLVARANFATSTAAAFGTLRARRVR